MTDSLRGTFYEAVKVEKQKKTEDSRQNTEYRIQNKNSDKWACGCNGQAGLLAFGEFVHEQKGLWCSCGPDLSVPPFSGK